MSLLTRRALLAASSFDRETRRFTAVAASSTPVFRYHRESDRTLNEVLDISPTAIDLSRLASGRAPILNTHRAGTAADQIGVIRSARIEGGELVIEGELSSRADVAGIVADVAAGILTNVSVGFRILASEIVPGQRGADDTLRVTRWLPVEVSLVPVPADPAAHVRSGVTPVEPDQIEGAAPGATPPAPPATPQAPPRRAVSAETRAERERVTGLADIARRSGCSEADVAAAIEDGTSLDVFRTRAFDAMAARSESLRTGYAAHPGHREGGVPAAIGAALYARMSGKPPEGQAREFMGRSLLELGTTLLEVRGERVRWSDRDQLAEQVMTRNGGGHTTSDFPALLTQAGNRVLAEAYEAAGTPLKLLARRRTRSDFKPVTGVHLSEAPRLERVNEQGEIKHGSRGEESRPLYKVETFARLFSLSRNAIINDDLNAFADALSAFGQGAAQTENDELVALFLANGGAGATLFDNKSLYHVDHGNIGAAAGAGALSVDALGAGRQALRQMKGLDGITPINVTPKHLVVGPELETAAEKVLTALNATQTQDANPFPGKLTLHVEPRFAGNAWRLFADPGAMPCIEIAYLAGREGPQLSFREGWSTLGVEFRAVLDFGCGLREWRGTYLNPAK